MSNFRSSKVISPRLRAASRALRSSANCFSDFGGSVLVGELDGVDLDRLGSGASDGSVLFGSVLGVEGSWAFTPEARATATKNSWRQNDRKQGVATAVRGARIRCLACSRGRFDILFFVPWRVLFSEPGNRSVSKLVGGSPAGPRRREYCKYTHCGTNLRRRVGSNRHITSCGVFLSVRLIL
jgi:hypothetical protein